MPAIDLAYREFGDGPPLIVLHGLLGSSRNWYTIARRLQRLRRVLTLDLRNHGDSEHLAEMNYPVMADDVLWFMDQQRIARADLLGHSMGGKVAMHLALSAPARIDRLIIVDIAPVAYTDRFSELLDTLAALPLDKLASRREADEALARSLSDAPLRAFLLQNLVSDGDGLRWRVDLHILRAALPALMDFPAPARGTRYERPCLFIRGAGSSSLDAEHRDALYRYFPAAELREIGEAGHWPHVEAPRVFLQILSGYLQGAP